MRRAARALMVLPALILGLILAMSIFGIPASIHRWFATADIRLAAPARTIVVLGGGGIPSETGLMRTYTAAALRTEHPAARYICALPADADPETSSVGRMRDELVLRGVPREAVTLEYRARNTREQAAAVRALLGETALGDPLLLVTSPDHARRALLCFRRAGFAQVACAPAVATSAEADMGPHVFARYGFWNLLECQVHYARELTALAWYKLRGWI